MGINSPRQVEVFRDKAVQELKNYCCSNQTGNRGSEDGETRFSRLLLSLSPLRSIQPDVLEELFFAGLIGNVQIDSVVPYILKMESSEYQSQFGGGNWSIFFTIYFKVRTSYNLTFEIQRSSVQAVFWRWVWNPFKYTEYGLSCLLNWKLATFSSLSDNFLISWHKQTNWIPSQVP